MIKKQVLLVFLAITAFAVSCVGLYLYLQKPTVTNFEECMQVKGSFVLESYPRQCQTPDGKTFTEEIATANYGEPFEGVLEFAEGNYYTKEEAEEKTEEEAFTYLKNLTAKIEKAWYFKPQTSCGQLQVIVLPKIVIKVKTVLVDIPPGFTEISEVSQCANQSGWYFEQFEDCVSKYGDKYPGAYEEGEMECYLSQEECSCWDGTSGICTPVRHCVGQ